MDPSTSAPPPSDRPSRVLVVDDDDARRRMLRLLFEHEGYEVRDLPSPRGALDVVAEYAPDVILLDVMLPESSGFELCGDIRMMDNTRLIAVILITSAHIEEASVVRGLLCGADDYVVMPGRLTELKARVRVQLRNKRDRELLRWAQAQRSSLKTAAQTDALTGIANRRRADAALTEALNGEEPLLLLTVDVDHFKGVNDRFGHDVGDRVLTDVAAVLTRRTRKGDLAARVGGEEFSVLIFGAGREHAEAIGERYRSGIAELVIPGIGEPVTASVGVSVWNGRHPAPTPDQLRKASDEALYEAKRTGRNRVVVATEDLGGDRVNLTQRPATSINTMVMASGERLIR